MVWSRKPTRSLLLALTLLLISLLSSSLLPAAAAPAAQTTAAWTGQYFANPNLQGTPELVREDPAIDFDWGSNSPDPSLPTDGFSVRWQRWVYMDARGDWTFTATADDGVRLFVDDTLVLDAWSDQTATAHTVTVNLTQAYHLVRVEYYDHEGNAEVHLEMISASFPDWRGEYYDNADLAGEPAFVRNDSTLNFNYGTAGPGGGLPGAPFSVRWTRALELSAGRYRFTALSDDGVRLWVDNRLIVDQWHDQVPTNRAGDVTLTAGLHLVRMEYFNHSGAGLAVLTWVPLSGSGEVWHGEYYDNSTLSGPIVLQRDSLDLDYNWGTAIPGPGVTPGPDWSARFTAQRTTSLAGLYTVTATSDDGVRVWVDDQLLVDAWHDQPPTPYSASVYLQPGAHTWRVEYYQHGGSASLSVHIIAGVVSPQVLPAAAAVSDVVVEDKDAHFVSGGAAENWHEVSAGSGDHAFWMQNSTFSQALDNWARWYPTLAAPGSYDVAVFVPGNVATTHNARYWIYHAGAFDMRAVNQSLYANQWISLGTFDFDADSSEYVLLDNTTYEPALSTVIAVDAIKFSPR